MARSRSRAPAAPAPDRQLRARSAAALRVAARAARARAALASLLLAVAAPGARADEPCTDATPPQLEITSPARAAAIEQGGPDDAVVIVSGAAEDLESPLVSLIVNGQELLAAPASGPQPFAVPTTSRWGLTIVTASAQDACGNRSERAQSFLRSGAYEPAEPNPPAAARVWRALAIRAGQELLDDGDRTDPDDLATLAGAALADLDWNEELPEVLASDPLRGGCACQCANPGACLGACCPWDLQCPTWADYGYSVSRGDVSTSGLRVTSLAAGPSGLSARVDLESLQAPLAGSVRARTCTAGVPATFGPISLSGTASGTEMFATGVIVPSTAPDGGLGTGVTGVYVQLGDLDVALACNGIEIVCDARDAIANVVLDLLDELIADGLADAIASSLPPLLRDFLSDFRLPPTLDVPPPIAVTLDVDSGFDGVATSTSGIDLGIAARLQPSEVGGSIPPDARGPVRRGGTPPADPAAGRALGIAVKDDLVNQLFWAVWYGGGLDLPDLRGEALAAGYAVESLSLQAALPPVARSGETHPVEIGFGDVWVELAVDAAELLGPGASGLLEVDFYFSAFLDGRIGVSPPERMRFDVEGVRAASEIVAASDRALAELARPQLDALLASVAQRLVDDALGGLLLPTLAVAETFPASGAPPDAVLGLADGAFVQRLSGHYTRLAGDVAFHDVPEPAPLAGGLAALLALAALSASRRRALRGRAAPATGPAARRGRRS